MLYIKSYQDRDGKPFPKILSLGPLFIKKLKELVFGPLGIEKISEELGIYEIDLLDIIDYLQIGTASSRAYKIENRREVYNRLEIEESLFENKDLNLKELAIKNKTRLKYFRREYPDYYQYLIRKAKSLQDRANLPWNEFVCYLKTRAFCSSLE